ncbi:helix-turn-helix domain-containing protein [Galbitalea sp. SE-J8]|uniref:XRE family transcriptional regulator n=1 Tax=Galbitalea sp. SE-J8 TaxID=3054952 RepID=UPI00259D0F71|nr:XRE family transcriptional regulator [Galbitalea sp. SE-J8]MDM4764333.1 helix-turn-helix domain-containing protein [Galbitalea sp. SE-J8]
MGTETIGEELRLLRRAAGLTQRELAARSRVPQPNISDYERGRRVPTAYNIEKLGAVLRVPSISGLAPLRTRILDLAAARGLSDVRVFGSIARGTATARSDLDLLVHPSETSSIFDLAGFMQEVRDVTGLDVDVVSDRGTGPTMDRIRAEATTL